MEETIQAAVMAAEQATMDPEEEIPEAATADPAEAIREAAEQTWMSSGRMIFCRRIPCKNRAQVI